MSNLVYEIPILDHLHSATPLLYVTKSIDEKDWHSLIHSHHFTELLYITEGKGSVFIAGKEISVSKHDLIIINAYIDHTEKSSLDHPLEYIALGIQGIFFLPTDQVNAPIPFHIYRDKDAEYLVYLKKLVEEVQNQKKSYAIITQSLLDILLIKILRKNTLIVEKSENQKLTKEINEIKKYIENSFREEINLDSLAKISHLNKYYLAHSFKSIIGISPIEYLINIRIRESKIILKTTNYPISDVSAIIGFSSQSFFSQSFKRVTNMTPSAYRKSKSKVEKK
ncbi:MAG: AraC family transcriptional regulator [Carnobacterium sp.]|uniref:helix-turn-helix transcriptional regulator n=1 Tax=Carnobacterium sp. TaxID=48221 RepID=UPI003C7305CE